jgi:hypothetical protein
VSSAREGSPLVVRRARWFVTTHLVLACLLLVLATGVALHAYRQGENLMIALFFLALLGVFWWQAVTQYRDRAPIIVVRGDGLLIPSASPQPIPWNAIGRVGVGRWIFAHQIELQVGVEILAGLKLGQRYMGDFVVKGRGFAPSVMILTRGLDHGGPAILAAIKNAWLAGTESGKPA